MLQSHFSQGSSAEIRVQDYTRRIDDWTQRIAEILPKLAFNRNNEVREREIDTRLIKFSQADLAAQTLEYSANRVQHSSMAVIGCKRGQGRAAHKHIHRREHKEK